MGADMRLIDAAARMTVARWRTMVEDTKELYYQSLLPEAQEIKSMQQKRRDYVMV
jgi:hypothetical protein